MYIKNIILNIINKSLEQKQWEDEILKNVESNSDASFLSLGCSQGEFTKLVAQHIGTPKINAIEIVPEYVLSAQNKGINAILGDLNEAFHFNDQMFDVILSNNDIEHLTNTDRMISECYRVLKTRGYLVIATPNLASFSNILFLLLGKQPFMVEVSDKIVVGNWGIPRMRLNPSEPGHRRLFTVNALKQLLEWNGFKIEKIIRSDFRPFPKPLSLILSKIFPFYASSIIIKARKTEV